MSGGLDRQIKPIYDALDSNSPKSAIVTCNKLLKKNPSHALVKSLKALALLRLQKIEECLVLVDEVLPTKPVHDGVLTALMHVLRGLGRNKDVVSMFEEAHKQQPNNEDLAAQVFYGNMRVFNWKAAQQVATRMHKQFQDERYLFWAVMSAILQAKDPSTDPALRTVLFKLAHRLVTSSPTPPHSHPERFHLHLTLIKELQLWDEADKLLTSDIGKNICSTSLACEELRRDIWRNQGALVDDGEIARERITEKTRVAIFSDLYVRDLPLNSDRNWLEFLAILDATFSYDTKNSPEDVQKAEQHLANTHSFLTEIAEKDGLKDRSARLALLELERRKKQSGLLKGSSTLPHLIKEYFELFGDKACCFEDLKPFLDLPQEELSSWTSFLQSTDLSAADTKSLQRLINVHKLTRYTLAKEDLSADKELERVHVYIRHYFDGLPLGSKLPSTELQPVDDLAILAASGLINVWSITQEAKHLQDAASILEFTLSKSKQAFQARLILIRIYRILGAPSLALEHYRALNVKQVQQDTLSHLILSRASTFSLGATGDMTMLTECFEASQIYISNQQDTSEYIGRAFQGEKYSQIPEFLEFENRLEQSLQRDLTRMEQGRMRFASEVPQGDPLDMELIDLKFIYERHHHDNRDFSIFPNYQPAIVYSLEQQTRLFSKSEDAGWLWALLHGYARLYQQASDLSDAVEEKLLVGDRPKRNRDPKMDPCLLTSFSELNDEALGQCTSEERAFLLYLEALGNWLGPHHDHVRPPPAVALANAAKQSELKTGIALKGLELPSSENGQAKKGDPPVVKDSPDIVNDYFNGAKQRFSDAIKGPSVVDALHIASLLYEAFLLLFVDTARFKSSTVVKVHKLGNLAQNCKNLRADALAALRDISKALVKQSETEAGIEARKVFIDSCSVTNSTPIDRDFVLGVAKKVTEARKKAIEGAGKGLARVASTYTNLI